MDSEINYFLLFYSKNVILINCLNNLIYTHTHTILYIYIYIYIYIYNINKHIIHIFHFHVPDKLLHSLARSCFTNKAFSLNFR